MWGLLDTTRERNTMKRISQSSISDSTKVIAWEGEEEEEQEKEEARYYIWKPKWMSSV